MSILRAVQDKDLVVARAPWQRKFCRHTGGTNPNRSAHRGEGVWHMYVCKYIYIYTHIFICLFVQLFSFICIFFKFMFVYVFMHMDADMQA